MKHNRNLKAHLLRYSPTNLIYLGLIVIGLTFTIGAVERMSKNWQLQETYEKSLKELERLEIEVEALELDNEYYKTAEYQELAARRLLNKKLAGETMIYLPENSPVAKAKHSSKSEIIIKDYTNPEKWQLFFFR